MFDLAINTTLDPKNPSCRRPNPNPTLGSAPTPYPGIGVCDFFILSERSFQDFCSLVYSTGLSGDLDEIFVEIQDSSASHHQKIKVVISPVNLIYAIFGVTEKRRCSFQSSTI
ncbi:hypothetical protein GQ457_03G018370 [Hibiscus cannabinus]